MPDYGMTITPAQDMTRIQVTCEHQSGLIYVVPAERSWVCDPDKIPAHALAGFFRELVALNDPNVREIMARWGIFYRQLPVDGPVDGPVDDQESSPAK